MHSQNTLATIQDKDWLLAREIVSNEEISTVETELKISDIQIAKDSILNGMVDEEAFFPCSTKHLRKQVKP